VGGGVQAGSTSHVSQFWPVAQYLPWVIVTMVNLVE
jgi:hypothetical protein